MDVLSVARGSEKKQHRAPGAAQTTQSTGAGEGRCPGRAPSAGPCNGRKPEPFLSRRLGTDRPSGQRGKEEKQRLIQAWETFTGQVGPSWCHFSGDSEPTCPPLHCLLGALSHLDPGTDMSNAAVLPSPAAPPGLSGPPCRSPCWSASAGSAISPFVLGVPGAGSPDTTHYSPVTGGVPAGGRPLATGCGLQLQSHEKATAASADTE